MTDTVYTRLSGWAARRPTATALCAPGRDPVTFAALLGGVDAIAATLAAHGFGADDRIALVAARGVDTAVALLGLMCGAVCVPINPHAPPAEIDDALAATGVRALALASSGSAVGVEVARRRGLPVIRLSGGSPNAGATDRRAVPGGVALVLRTSGSTAAPKLVPSRHAHLVARADKAARLLDLDASDRCLNLMPLCYAHGLYSGLLTAVLGGGSAICPLAFDEETFFACLQDGAPTWYTGGAVHHRAILDWLRRRPATPRAPHLRFARSGSSPLSATVQGELERRLGVPLVEAYATSETGIVTATRPGGARGAVGRVCGDEVRVVDANGVSVSAGSMGEIVVRGATVVDGYDGDPEANARAFRGGWYRTGDQGWVDAVGHLTLAGRLDDVINRGGEKIAPREVEAALLRHPAVADAVVFAVPHPTLHQDVAAAVVSHPDHAVAVPSLREFLGARLAPFKVPRRIAVTDALPRGPTGKLQRHRLAGHFGFVGAATPRMETTAARPATPLAATLRSLWQEVLDRDDLDGDADFFASGGDSLSAIRLLAAVEHELGVELPLLDLMARPTPALLADAMQRQTPGPARDVVGVHVTGARPPVFAVCGRYGYALRVVLLGRALGADQPFYALQPPAMDWASAGCRTIPEMAGHYLAWVRALQPHGPYRLFGTSFGGLVVFEMACQLQAAGETVAFLGLLDTQPTTCRWRDRLERADGDVLDATTATLAAERSTSRSAVEAAGLDVARAHVAARRTYVVERMFDGELTYLLCEGEAVAPRRDRRRLWRRFARGGVRWLPVAGVHGHFHQAPQFAAVVDALRACLDGAPLPSLAAATVFGARYRLDRDGDGEWIRGADGSRRRVEAAQGSGAIDVVTVVSGTLVLQGWASRGAERTPADRVVLFCGGRYVGYGGCGVAREDVAAALASPALQHAGFVLRVPWPAGATPAPLRVFSFSDREHAAELPVPEGRRAD